MTARRMIIPDRGRGRYIIAIISTLRSVAALRTVQPTSSVLQLEASRSSGRFAGRSLHGDPLRSRSRPRAGAPCIFTHPKTGLATMNNDATERLELRLAGDVPAETLARLPELLARLAPTSIFPGEWPWTQKPTVAPPRFRPWALEGDR